jgi:hypothetical protein
MRNRLVVFLLLFAGFCKGIVIVPPVVYFITLSISAFLANALVSLLLFGALRGLLFRNYFGKTPYELLKSSVSIVGMTMVAVLSMLLSVIALYPTDFRDFVFSGLLAGVLFLLFESILKFREYRLVGNSERQSIAVSLILLSAFIAVATGVSANFAIELKSMKAQGAAYEERHDAVYDISHKTESIGAPSLGIAQEKAYERGEGSIWFMPAGSGECFITIGSFSKSFSPSFRCLADEEGGKKRVFCPVQVPHYEIKERGLLKFKAAGSCDDSGSVLVSDYGFEKIER